MRVVYRVTWTEKWCGTGAEVLELLTATAPKGSFLTGSAQARVISHKSPAMMLLFGEKEDCDKVLEVWAKEGRIIEELKDEEQG